MKELLRVSKDNALISASYRLSLTEMQIVLYGIGLVNPVQPNFPLCYCIDIVRFAEMFNRNHGDIYKEVKEAVLKRFWERDFSYINEKGETVVLRWLTKIAYKDDSGHIEIKFSEEVQPYLHQLKNNFTAYYIDQVVSFKSIYSVRFYENALMILNKHQSDRAKFSLLISDIKNQLELSNKYDRFFNFKTFVLDKAKKEINQFSDLNFDYKVIKWGRSPKEVEFTVSRKKSLNETKESKFVNKQPTVSTTALETAKKLALTSRTGWDIYEIEQQFYAYIEKAGCPRSVDAAFVGFVKKKLKLNVQKLSVY